TVPPRGTPGRCTGSVGCDRARMCRESKRSDGASSSDERSAGPSVAQGSYGRATERAGCYLLLYTSEGLLPIHYFLRTFRRSPEGARLQTSCSLSSSLRR